MLTGIIRCFYNAHVIGSLFDYRWRHCRITCLRENIVLYFVSVFYVTAVSLPHFNLTVV